MTTQSDTTYDVIIAGGGSAGVAAAVASVRAGARTLLLERHHCLGGASTLRNVSTYCGLYTLEATPKMVVGGVGAEIVQALSARGAITGPLRHRGVFAVFDPETVKAVLDDVCEQAGVHVRLASQVIAAGRTGDRISDVTVAGHGGTRDYHARAFVDCTGDGDLMTLGGAGHRYGNPDGVNLATLGTRFGGVPRDVKVSADDMAVAVAALDPSARTRVTKDRSVTVRLPISGDLVCYLASVDYDARDTAQVSAAEREGRRQAWIYLDALRTVPGCAGAYLISTGPEFGTRECRHLAARRQLTWADITARASFDDTIALGAWGAEWHDRGSFVSTFDYPPERTAYEIPLSCLISGDTANLFAAGRLADGDRLAGAAIRVMGTAFALGQAAGVAAALCAGGGAWFADEVRRELVRQGGIIDRGGIRPVPMA